jgi:hypothetical protein
VDPASAVTLLTTMVLSVQNKAVVRPVVTQREQGHGIGALIPLVGQYDPMGQGRHALMADAPALGLYEPFGHGRHALIADAPSLGLYVPLKQAVIVPEPVVQNDPAGHASKYATIVIPAATTETSENNDAPSVHPKTSSTTMLVRQYHRRGHKLCYQFQQLVA